MMCPRCGKESLDMVICAEEVMCPACYDEDAVVGKKALKPRKKVKGSLEE